ncbi:hypothetical protein Tco_0451231 [Tanacetum coccineum]
MVPSYLPHIPNFVFPTWLLQLFGKHSLKIGSRFGIPLSLPHVWKLSSVTSSLRRPVRGGSESSQLSLLQVYIEGTILPSLEDSLVTDIVRLVCLWWNIAWPSIDSYSNWLHWFNAIRLSPKVKDLLEGVFYITWWSIWRFRNQVLFSSLVPRKDVLFDDIVSRSFTWCRSRCKIIPGRVLVPPGSVVVPPGSVVVPTGSVVVPTGSVVVPPGSVVVPTGSVLVTPGSVITTGSILVYFLSLTRL